MGTLMRDNRLTRTQSLACGGVAGVVSRTTTAPLDVVKVLSQVGTFHCKKGFLKTFQTVYETEGLRAFWKGNFVACFRLVPYSAIQLSAYNKFINLFMDDLGQVTQWGVVVAGSLAGIVATILTYPTDVIKTRLIVQDSCDPTYRGFLHAFHLIYKKEGFLALFRGASLTVLGAVPFSAGSFFVYTNLDKLWNKPSTRMSPLQNFTSGCVAAGVAQTLSFPFETVKRKMQAQSPFLPHYGGVDVHFTGIIDCFRQIVKVKGWLGLWSGLTANLVKIVPYCGLMFCTFEFCKRVCLYRNGYILSPLSYQPIPGVDQSLHPQELQELRKFLLRRKNFDTNKSTLSNCREL
ncbi:solute carrier family 25 member 43 [Protopterus annectens]|uniref:solute carrier family 25 member 43 n=1 Tax=Protopterus annectens TaxID=7888 RepID=UPI001CF960B6|nr:solute carrier family 25 member 43 [Protopterus annectens]